MWTRFKIKKLTNSDSQVFVSLYSGAGGSRTRVQTSYLCAFYTLITVSIVGKKLEQNKPAFSLVPIDFATASEPCSNYLKLDDAYAETT
jgi:hypothetical protein